MGSVDAEPPAGLRAAQDLARALAARVIPLARPGVTELELLAEVHRVGAELGSTGTWTPPTTRVGLGSLVAHPEFPMQDRVARAGDTVVLDVAPTLGGWLGDFCVSTTLDGGPDGNKAAEDVVAGCRWVQQRMIEAVVPGMPANELHAIGLRLAADRDLRQLDLLDNFGHSIGREFAAEGFIDRTNSTPMYGAWTIEPHLGRLTRGAKFEDIVWLAPGAAPTVV